MRKIISANTQEATDGKMLQDGDEILNGMVVEMAFDKNEETGWY